HDALPIFSRRDCDVCGLAADEILRQYCAVAGCGFILDSGDGASARRRGGISTGGCSLPDDLRFRRASRLDGDSLPALGGGGRGWDAGGLCGVELTESRAGAARVSLNSGEGKSFTTKDAKDHEGTPLG